MSKPATKIIIGSVTAILIIAGVIAYIKRTAIKESWEEYEVRLINDAEIGTKLYLRDETYGYKMESTLLYRLAKANNSSNIITILTHQYIPREKLDKQRSAYIGTLLKKVYVPVKNSNVKYMYFKISPPSKLISGSDDSKPVPQGYTLIDSGYYVMAMEITDEDSDRY